MRTKRMIWFVLMILVGLAAGLGYGWLVNPVQYVDTSADTLHPGYKADYVLMVAEIYHLDSDLPGAIQRLALLGELPPLRQVADALLTAREAGYSQPDIDLIESLRAALQLILTPAAPAAAPTPTGGQP